MDIILGNSACVLQAMPYDSVDLVVTSPPYDSLRRYGGVLPWDSETFAKIAIGLFRVLKLGGVVVWVVGDATVNGSESGTSFQQALYFKQLGFNLHDTMIYAKNNVLPLSHPRYEQAFEYMFVLSKGTPKTVNLIHDKPNKYAGYKMRGTVRKPTGELVRKSGHNAKVVSEFGRRGNIWYYNNMGKAGTQHPATFPIQLARDHVLSWSNPGDVVLDPFMGSGTVGMVCAELERNFIGIEVNPDYFEISKSRIDSAIL